MNGKRILPAFAGTVALVFCSSAYSASPTVIGEPGHTDYHLFATLGNDMGRLEWSPASGWSNYWAHHPNNSTAATHHWIDKIAVLGWYDINQRPTGLIGGPQMESFVGFYNSAAEPRVGRFRLAGDYGTNYQWNSYWTYDVPPHPNQGAFIPEDGYVFYDNGTYRRHVFGDTSATTMGHTNAKSSGIRSRAAPVHPC